MITPGFDSPGSPRSVRGRRKTQKQPQLKEQSNNKKAIPLFRLVWLSALSLSLFSIYFYYYFLDELSAFQSVMRNPFSFKSKDQDESQGQKVNVAVSLSP